MMAHQRGGMNANNRINDYLKQYYPTPKDFESLLYMTQIQQGDAIRTAVEAHRRDKPFCMGSLFWQHNDCWPVASWSSRDYYGYWKAQHHFARRFFDDILVSNLIDTQIGNAIGNENTNGESNENTTANTIDSSTLTISVVSDRMKPVDGTLKIQVLTLEGKQVFDQEQMVSIPENGVSKLELNLNDLIGDNDKANLIILSEYTTNQADKYQANTPLLKDKDMNYQKPNLKWSVSESNGDKYLDISSDTFVRGLFISIPETKTRYSDNFFDILPGQTLRVRVDIDAPIETVKNNIKFTDIYSSSHGD